ncbi:MAG: DUF1015 domain-containing protein [Spirochaetes bacterium]|nr:MAG: DUF1015 domain-containing protein [Spirochaetota bacterium]
MARIKAFRGLRPEPGRVSRVAELPYDVVSSDEARAIAQDRPESFFHVSKPEIDLPAHVSMYDDSVYAAGRKNLERFIADGVLKKDDGPALYLYTLVMAGREQTGLVTCLSIDDYMNELIKKHELTREDKEKDRMRHMDELNVQAGLVFTFYKEDGAGAPLFARALALPPESDFTTGDGIRHVFRVIRDAELIAGFTKMIAPRPLYIADGHHRAASAAKLGIARRATRSTAPGESESDWFMAVVFPHDQLRIFPYNRVVKDLQGASPAQFIEKLSRRFKVGKTGEKMPPHGHSFCMYLEHQWYLIEPSFKIAPGPIEGLDVTVLQNEVLGPLLGIADPRRDKRIDFIGGIRGPEELERVVDAGAFKVAFSMYATSIEELIAVADINGLMPPKSTWFEPKVRSGIVLHQLD